MGSGWPDDTGIVRLPSGRTIRGRALRRPTPADPPDFGLYLTARPPPATDWDQGWIAWRDFWLPADRTASIRLLADALDRTGEERVEVACPGGRGRTGTALGVLAILDGVDPDDATNWVRANYHARAIETPWQRRWLESLSR